MGEDPYVNIRELLGHLVGKRIVEITQQDEEEYEETGQSYVHIILDDGNWVKFIIGDGFSYSED